MQEALRLFSWHHQGHLKEQYFTEKPWENGHNKDVSAFASGISHSCDWCPSSCPPIPRTEGGRRQWIHFSAFERLTVLPDQVSPSILYNPAFEGWRASLVAILQKWGDAPIKLIHQSLWRAFADGALVTGRECSCLLALPCPS